MHFKSLFIVTLNLLVLTSCIKTNSTQSPFLKNIKCDFETLTEDQKHIVFEGSTDINYEPSNRTDSISHSGRYAYHIRPDNPYSFSLTFDTLQTQSIIDLSFWCYGKAPSIVIQEINMNEGFPGFYYAHTEILKEEPSGWKLIGIKKRLPSNIHGAKIYLWNAGKESVFIDDYSFNQLSPQKRNINQDQLLKIIVDSNAYAKLNQKRIEAFRNGILEANDSDYVNARIVYLDDTIKSKIRLKGDWLDHLEGDKWSLRIKLKKDSSWKGMQTFSIQAPETRSYLNEWVAHQLFKKLDILTTRYGFINVELNGIDLGVYAYEEFFEKQLIESNSRREGPILKFSEAAAWFNYRIECQTQKTPNLPAQQTSVILPFKESKTLASPGLLSQFKNGQNLMLCYRDKNVDATQIFDVDKLAKYWVFINLTRSYHGTTWHNQRFYYNPVLSLLEPIAYDGYSDVSYDFLPSEVFGYTQNQTINHNDSPLYMQYFLSKSFHEKYFTYLEKYCNRDFINSFYAEIKDELNDNIKLIQSEYYYYTYDSALLVNNANTINEILNSKPEYKQWNPIKMVNNTQKNNYDTIRNDKAIETAKFYIQAYLEHSEPGINQFKIVNNYSVDIHLIGYYLPNGKKIYYEKPSLIGSINRNNNSNKTNLTFNRDISGFLYTLDGISTDTLLLDYYKWNYPTHYSPRNELLSSINKAELKKYIVGNKVIIPSGKTVISKPFIVPENYTLVIQPGAIIDLTNKAFIMSYGSVSAKGNEKNRIKITSSDGTAMGVITLQANKKSELTYVIFDQLNTLNYKGWVLTGAVTFFESNVEMDHVEFNNNLSEDALNIIRSEFTLTSCTFDNIFGDAFDSDFSNGSISQTQFTYVGNDAVDCSGSHVTIDNCTIYKTCDKGISGGELSDLEVNNISIKNVVIAIASKDKSSVTATNTNYSNASYGLVCFKKKPEYGPAFISATNCSYQCIKTPELIEQNSVLIFNGDTIQGQGLKVASMFY